MLTYFSGIVAALPMVRPGPANVASAPVAAASCARAADADREKTVAATMGNNFI
ncbi:hypothetical protein D3C87_1955050 [compost metagenome]